MLVLGSLKPLLQTRPHVSSSEGCTTFVSQGKSLATSILRLRIGFGWNRSASPKTKKLAEVGPECPNKTAARDLAREFLETINRARKTPESTMTLIRFVEGRYLPFVKEHKRISTYHRYRNMWKRYLESRGEVMLREFRTVDGERILESIAKDNDLTSTTLAHIKALLSGIFRYAKRQGVINSENPMRDVVLPKGKPPGETHAYSLEEIMLMLTVLPEPAATIVAAAAFAGARKGEVRGLGEVRRGADIYFPVLLERPRSGAKDAKEHGPSSGDRATRAATGIAPVLARDVIVPLATKAGGQWHGWHAFRRGLATNLYRLGVSDKTIQRMRQANVGVTQRCYIKTADSDATAAMQQFERSLEHAPNMHLSGAERPRLM